MEEEELSTALHQSVLEGVRNVLGEDSMQVLLFHLQVVHYVQNPREFHRNLCVVFKEAGAVTLEKVIVKELFRRLNLPFEETGDFDFEKYLNLAKQILVTRLEASQTDRSK